MRNKILPMYSSCRLRLLMVFLTILLQGKFQVLSMMIKHIVTDNIDRAKPIALYWQAIEQPHKPQYKAEKVPKNI